MKLDGCTDDEMTIFERSASGSGGGCGVKKLPPPPPPLPPMNAGARTGSSLQANLLFLADIKNGNFNLKKSSVPNTASVKNKILKLVDQTKKVPSLQDILEAKSKLRKPNYT
jgi:hypothetical protein